MQDKIKQLLSDIQAGDFKALARGITIVENELNGYEALLLQLRHTASARLIGITGPPGAGKSTLINTLLRSWNQAGKRIAVVAVDPSSPFNFGALLGDRIRMTEFYNHSNVFIRSLATRGVMGGLNAKIMEITDLIKTAPFDYIIIETVGVGQSEVDIAGLADCTVVALVPEAGDEVQTLKAGIMEIAQVFVVNKADRDGAEGLYRTLKVMVHERAGMGHEIPVLKTSAIENSGIEDLAEAIDHCLRSTTGIHEKQLHLLAEKAWQLIQAGKMKGVDRTALMQELKKHLEGEGPFNLYSFIKIYI